MFNRSRRRLAYWFTLSMGSILTLFAFTIYYRQVEDQLRVFDQLLYSQSKKIASSTKYEFEQGRLQIEPENVSLKMREALPLELNIVYIRWYNSQKKLIQFIGATAPRQSTVESGWQTLDRHNNHQKIKPQQSLRQFTLPVKQDETIVAYLQVAASIEPIQESLARSRMFLSLGVPIALGLTGLVGWLLGGVAMQPIRRSYEQLQRFTADASHELRAPVAAILSNAQVGLLAPKNDCTQPRQRLENIVTLSKSMSALINNLLFLARHEGRLNQKDVKTTDISELLSLLVDEYTALAAEKELNFSSYLTLKSVRLDVDSELLQQAVRNLLNNAFKYTPSGGMVTLKLLSQPRRVLIQVEDTGIGIPAKDLSHIFDRFYRVDEARARQTGGFGLGLAIAQQIVQAHGGNITVDSIEGKGTTFQIFLPLRGNRDLSKIL